MKHKILKLSLLGLLTAGWIGAVNADMVVNSMSFANDEDLCNQIAGHWLGEGKVTMGLTCKYKGTGDVVSKKPGEFDMHVVLNKESGAICPDENLNFHGMCKNGVITIKSTTTDLTGRLSEGGKRADVSGTVTYAVFKLHVDINLHK